MQPIISKVGQLSLAHGIKKEKKVAKSLGDFGLGDFGIGGLNSEGGGTEGYREGVLIFTHSVPLPFFFV